MSVLEQHVCHKNQSFVFRAEGTELCNNFEVE